MVGKAKKKNLLLIYELLFSFSMKYIFKYNYKHHIKTVDD